MDSAAEFNDGYNRVVSRYYDAAYATLPNLGPDVEFYARRALDSGGPALELGCGTGRVLLERRSEAHALPFHPVAER